MHSNERKIIFPSFYRAWTIVNFTPQLRRIWPIVPRKTGLCKTLSPRKRLIRAERFVRSSCEISQWPYLSLIFNSNFITPHFASWRSSLNVTAPLWFQRKITILQLPSGSQNHFVNTRNLNSKKHRRTITYIVRRVNYTARYSDHKRNHDAGSRKRRTEINGSNERILSKFLIRRLVENNRRRACVPTNLAIFTQAS